MIDWILYGLSALQGFVPSQDTTRLPSVLVDPAVIVAVLQEKENNISPMPVPNAVNPGRPVGVCEVLGDLTQFRGKVIEVRGEWDYNLRGDCGVIKTAGYTWPNAIPVGNWFNAGTRVELPNWEGIPLDTYEWILKGVRSDLATLPADVRKKAVVVATVVGQLEVGVGDQPLSLNGFGLPMGVGVQNSYPAFLVLISIKDIQILVDGKPIRIVQRGIDP